MAFPSPDAESVPAIGLSTLPFYLGGFLGPFGTMIIVPMLPELRDRFDVGSAAISWGLSAYLFPMAALLLVSGTIGERFGRRLVLRVTLTGYIAASLLASVAPSLDVFLAARAIQGAGNAFITPLLIAGLADMTPPQHLGKRLGVYGSFQAAGGGLAPFAGGLAAAADWRIAFWATAAVTLVVVAFVPPGERREGEDRPSIRPLFSLRLIVLGVGTFAAAAGPIGAAILVGLKTRDILDMDAATAGFLLAGGNLAATLLAPAFGVLLDRHGPRACGLFSVTATSLVVAVLGVVDQVAATAVLYAVAGALFGFVVLVIQQVGASIVPENRGGALSAILSFRFMGHAAGPLLWVPVFEDSARAAFVGSAALGAITFGSVLVAIPRRRRAPDPPHSSVPGPAPAASVE